MISKVVIFSVLVLLTGFSNISLCQAASPTPATVNRQAWIYVYGGVNHPGRYHWFKGITLNDAIDAAGGLTGSTVNHIQIVHADGTRQTFKWDTLVDATAKADPLKPDDIVSVPIVIW